MTTYQYLTHNKKNTLLVVSTYPEAGTHHTGGGLASYTQNTLFSLKRAYPKQKIVVLADIIDQPETYFDQNILIIRCWKRNSPIIYLQLLRQLLRLDRIQKVLFGFEFAAYGDFWTTSLTPIFIALMRLFNKRVTTVLHQVVLHLDELSSHIGLKSPQQTKLYSGLLRSFYRLLVATSNQVVVLEPDLGRRIQKLTHAKHLHCLPHGTNPEKPINIQIARRRLNLPLAPHYVLAFGYLSHYKGSDLLVEAFSQPLFVNGHQVKLILAGDKNPTQGHKSHYRRFYHQLYSRLKDNPNIITTGFVAPQDIKTYFSAASLAIFPYRSFMSASGPVSLALSFGTPYIVSKKLAHYSPLTTNLTPQAIRQSITQVLANPRQLHRSQAFFHQFAHRRRFQDQATDYLNLLNLDYGPITA